MQQSQTDMLVLGGTGYIGRNFCELYSCRYGISFSMLNRGVTNPGLFPGVDQIRCDRNDRAACQNALSGRSWNAIIDFTAHEDSQIRNILDFSLCDYYVLVSSSAVDLSWPDGHLFSMAQNKLWCEHLVKRYVEKTLIVRPGFVCGKYDYTNRFEMIDGAWCWRSNRTAVRPMITVNMLSQTLVRLIAERRTGVCRAGYYPQNVVK